MAPGDMSQASYQYCPSFSLPYSHALHILNLWFLILLCYKQLAEVDDAMARAIDIGENEASPIFHSP